MSFCIWLLSLSAMTHPGSSFPVQGTGVSYQGKAQASSDMITWDKEEMALPNGDEGGEEGCGWQQGHGGKTSGTVLWEGRECRPEGGHFFPNTLCLSLSAPKACSKARSKSKRINSSIKYAGHMEWGKCKQESTSRKKKTEKGQESSKRQGIGWVGEISLGICPRDRLGRWKEQNAAIECPSYFQEMEGKTHNFWSQGHNRKSNYLSLESRF